jgi:hypothetical protein
MAAEFGMDPAAAALAWTSFSGTRRPGADGAALLMVLVLLVSNNGVLLVGFG